MLSQFMHGEQGALLATAQIVNTVPWTEAKFYAANQVADEARHVEVYRRYLTEKLPVSYPVNPHLHTLLSEISLNTPFMLAFRQLLFSKIVPNLKRLGLLTPRLREEFAELGVLHFEDMPDSTLDEKVTIPPALQMFLAQLGAPVPQ